MDQKDRIKEYFRKIVKEPVDPDLLDYAIDEMISRTMLYLNMTEVPQQFEMALVNILITQMSQYQKETAGIDESQTISKIEDNNQAITYGQKLLNFFSSEADNVVFATASGVLNRYRLAHVVYPPEDDEDENT